MFTLEDVPDVLAAMDRARIQAASQIGVLQLLMGAHAGDVANGRGAAQVLGHEDYKARPATYALLAALEYLGEEVPQRAEPVTYDADELGL